MLSGLQINLRIIAGLNLFTAANYRLRRHGLWQQRNQPVFIQTHIRNKGNNNSLYQQGWQPSG
jgi:hypothetical protein